MSSDDARLLTRLSAREAQRRIRDGKITAASLLEACLDRIRALDGQLLAWTHVDEASARAAARERDAERSAAVEAPPGDQRRDGGRSPARGRRRDRRQDGHD